MRPPIAHHRGSDGEEQTLRDHLVGVAALARSFASKFSLASAGELIGLVHDLGKYSDEFQSYLQSAVGLLNPDEDEAFVDATGLKGKVDHSTAGAQLIWKEVSRQGQLGEVAAQILAVCVASHHSGLIDCVTSAPAKPAEDGFTRRIRKPEGKAHLDESLRKVDVEVREQSQTLLSQAELIESLRTALQRIIERSPEQSDKSTVARFQIGLLVRLLFSCLVDADRLDSANFEHPRGAAKRHHGRYVAWEELAQRLERHVSTLESRNPIDKIRQEISLRCLAAAAMPRGTFTLSVPTGGGKTLASLRFALHHACKHGLDRVIFVVPFTSIIEQNADVVRAILEPPDGSQDRGDVVLEHHSNLTAEVQSWREKLLSENWDAPVVYTTSVQFLEALFGGGTRGARRMHQLANAVIVFDEVQSLPVKCVHVFNNAVNFLVEQCGSTVVLCTATQPLLHLVEPSRGAMHLSEGSEIIPSVQALFDALRRVDVKDQRKAGGWSDSEIAALAAEEAKLASGCLVVVNTKKMARALYRMLDGQTLAPLYHLSTSMCPAHRRSVLARVREHLACYEPVLCVSTQLIEAGVDVDFGSVIRCLAGLDSIAQAAGRCNRNGKHERGRVHVVNPASENLASLEDIRVGAETAQRVLDDVRDASDRYAGDVIGPRAMHEYYQNYFFARKGEMAYPVGVAQCGRSDTLLNLLSLNSLAVGDFARSNGRAPNIYLRQAFMTAGKTFQAIDAPTTGVIVPYGEAGKTLIAELSAARDVEKQYRLLRRAQQFTVNVFPHEFTKLAEGGALAEVQPGTTIHFLSERYYSGSFGLATDPVSDEELFYA